MSIVAQSPSHRGAIAESFDRVAATLLLRSAQSCYALHALATTKALPWRLCYLSILYIYLYRHLKFKNFIGGDPPNPPYERGSNPLSCSPPARDFGPRGTPTAFNGRTTFQKPTTALHSRPWRFWHASATLLSFWPTSRLVQMLFLV